jgi:hypothetical protein
MSKFCFFCIIAIVAFPFTAMAEQTTFGIVEFSINTGYYQFDDDSDFENNAIIGWGIGLNFSKRWAAVLQYSSICHEKKIGGVGEVTAFNYHVDAIRFFRTESSLRPYIVAGFGNIETEIDKKKNREFQLNGGFGLHYKINPNWFLRGDCRLFYETDTDMKDGAAHFIVGYRFGKGER